MNRRKAISLLLAASMVFSMNTFTFAAEETTTTVEATETVSEQATVSSDGFYGTHRGGAITTDYLDAIIAAQKANLAQSNNSFSNNAYSSHDGFDEDATGKFTDLNFGGMNYYSVVAATGSKIKPTDIWSATNGYNSGYYVSANGYKVGIKSVKITQKGQKAGDTVKFKFAKLLPAQNVVRLNGDSVTLSEAKKAYKDLKTAFKSVQALEFQSVVCPRYITTAVSANYVNDVIKAADKKQVSWDALSPSAKWEWNKSLSDYNNNWDEYNKAYNEYLAKYNAAIKDVARKQIDTGVVVTVKNGNIKKVQLPVISAVKSTSTAAGAKYSNGAVGGYNMGTYYKVSYKTLKKNKDYTISGNYVVLDPSTEVFYIKDNIANFEVK